MKLDDWCAAVGPVLFETAPMAAASPPIDRVAIVSWNTHVGGGDIEDVMGRVRRGDFTGGEPITDVVLLLQESYRSDSGVPASFARHSAAGRIAAGPHRSRDRDIRRVAEAHGMSVLYAPSMRNGAAAIDPEDRGNAIVSTIPLSNPQVVELPFERQRRAAVIATISGRSARGTPWRLRLVNVHLDTALALTRGGPVQARRRQAEALLSALAGSQEPTVVAGDLNAWASRHEPAVTLLGREFPDAPPVDGPTWIGPGGVRATLDYVFARGDWRGLHVSRLAERFGSDHFPLLALIEF